jgi:hypothetical protein
VPILLLPICRRQRSSTFLNWQINGHSVRIFPRRLIAMAGTSFACLHKKDSEDVHAYVDELEH